MAISAFDRRNYAQLNLPSLQELIVAPQYMTQRHEEALNNASLVLSEAEKAGLAANQDPNSNAARTYQAYTQSLTDLVDDLNSQGFNGSNVMPKLSRIRAAYNRDIQPILGAEAQQRADIQAYQEALQRDPTLLSNYDPSETSIDSYINRGNTPYSPQYISGNEITRQVGAAAKPFSTWVNQLNPELIKSGLPYQWFTMTQQGYSPEDVAIAISGVTGISPESATQGALLLANLRDQVLEANNVYGTLGNDFEQLNRAFEYANLGLYQAIGSKNFGSMTDNYGIEMAKLAAKAKLSGGDGFNSPALTPISGVRLDTRKAKKVSNASNLINNPFSGVQQWVLDSLQGVNYADANAPLEEKLASLYDAYTKGAVNDDGSRKILNTTPLGGFGLSSRSAPRNPVSFEDFQNNFFKRVKGELGDIPTQSTNIFELQEELDLAQINGVIAQKGYEIDAYKDAPAFQRITNIVDTYIDDGAVTDSKGKNVSRNVLFDKNNNLKPGIGLRITEEGLVLHDSKNKKNYNVNAQYYDDTLYTPLSSLQESLNTGPSQIRAMAEESLSQYSDEEIYENTGLSRQEALQLIINQLDLANSNNARQAASGVTAILGTRNQASNINLLGKTIE